MSDYDFRPGGSLKLKGGVAEGGIVKKCVDIVCLEVLSYSYIVQEEEVQEQVQRQG